MLTHVLVGAVVVAFAVSSYFGYRLRVAVDGPFSKTHVYYINLERSADRRQWTEHVFRSAASLKRVPAVDAQGATFAEDQGWSATNKTELDKMCKQQGGTCGEYALSLSHYNAMSMALADGVEMALIVEDDVSPGLIPLWTSSIEEVIQHADNNHPNWKILRLQYAMKHDFNKFRDAWLANPAGAFVEHSRHYYGTVAYLMRKETMKEVVTMMTNTDGKFDCKMQKTDCQSDMWLYLAFKPEQVLLPVPPMLTVKLHEGQTGLRSKQIFDIHRKIHESGIADSFRICIENSEYWTEMRAGAAGTNIESYLPKMDRWQPVQPPKNR